MTTSEKLAIRTYPGLQELHSQLQKLKNCFPQISNTSQQPLSRQTRNILYSRSFNSVAFSINKLLAQDDEEYKLSADGRITLRTTLSNAMHLGGPSCTSTNVCVCSRTTSCPFAGEAR